MDPVTLVVAVTLGVLLGAASSVVTRRAGTWPGVAFSAVAAGVGLALFTVLDFGPVLAAMLAFAVTAAIGDPRPPRPSTR